MIFTVINSLLYLGLLYWYWKKNRVIDDGFLLIAFWSLVATLGILVYNDKPYNWKFTLWPFLYLFCVFFAFTHYFFKGSAKCFPIDRLIHTKNNFLDILNLIYILCAIYELLNIDFNVFSYSYLAERGQDLYNQAHEEVKIVKGTLFYCQRYTSALFVLATISFFNYLAQGKTLFGWILFSFTFVSVLAGNASMATRGVMFSQVVTMVCVYLKYRPLLPSKVKKSIKVGGIIAGSILTAFFTAITISRFSVSFGEFVNPLQSVYLYFGHSMLCFNYGICDVDFNTYGGARTFYYFSRMLFGIDYSSIPNGATHFGSSFTTSFGLVVLDFGYIGTLIFGIILSYFMYKLWSGNNSKTFAGLYIYMFFLNRMFMAVFTNSPGSDYTYAWAFVVYFLLKFTIRPTSQTNKLIIR